MDLNIASMVTQTQTQNGSEPILCVNVDLMVTLTQTQTSSMNKSIRPIHIERKRKRFFLRCLKYFSLMFVVYSLIFFAFVFTLFVGCEWTLNKVITYKMIAEIIYHYPFSSPQTRPFRASVSFSSRASIILLCTRDSVSLRSLRNFSFQSISNSSFQSLTELSS